MPARKLPWLSTAADHLKGHTNGVPTNGVPTGGAYRPPRTPLDLGPNGPRASGRSQGFWQEFGGDPHNS